MVREPSALEAFFVQPRSLSESIALALANEDREFADTRWAQALTPSSKPQARLGGVSFGRRKVSSRVVRVSRRTAAAFAVVQRIGGRTGWYALDWFWELRGPEALPAAIAKISFCQRIWLR